MIWTLSDFASDDGGQRVLAEGEVQYAYVALDREPREWELRLLETAEKERASRFVYAADRRRFLVAHAALRRFLACYLPARAEALSFDVDGSGKPHLRLPPAAPAFHFNLSHSGEIALIAVSRAGALGVDVERERPMPDALEIAERYFSLAERRDLATLSPGEREAAFFRCWTRKEAVVKAAGEGLGRALDSFDVDLAPGSVSALRRFEDLPGGQCGWSLRDLPAPAGYVAAGAVSRSPLGEPARWTEAAIGLSAP